MNLKLLRSSAGWVEADGLMLFGSSSGEDPCRIVGAFVDEGRVVIAYLRQDKSPQYGYEVWADSLLEELDSGAVRWMDEA